MIPSTIKQIADDLSTLFSVNLFLINEEGIIQWVNEHMLKTANLSELKEVQGKHVRMFGEKSWLTTESVITSQEKSYSFENALKKNFFTIKIPHNREGFRGVIGLSFDITSLRKAEIAKQAFLSNMGHDLRTPLTGILGIAEIQGRIGTSDQDKEYGQWIYQAGKQLLELLTSVLDICALENPIDPIKKEKIDLVLFANEIQELMQPAISNKGLSFQVKLDPLPFILSDSIKLKRVLINLLSNAVKFTDEGEITLSIKLINQNNDKAQLEIQVTDTGIGIPEVQLDSIFERFYQIDPSYQARNQGNGWGLYLVKESLNALGGIINVKSEEGKGSCFTITLNVPLACDYPYQKLVLVVEDEKFNTRITENALLSLDYRVLTKSTGEAALQTLQQTHEFDWVLLDISLPDIEGIEVVKRYRQWEKKNSKLRLPIFALTPHQTKEIRKECFKAGIDYVLNKPFTKDSIRIIKLFLEDKCHCKNSDFKLLN
ncbi:MAG: ATP-binding protein [Candidatus Aquirickettsiella sp.]